MSNSWNTPKSGVIAQITTGLDMGYSFMPYERSAGKSASDILKQVDEVLQSTNTVLENHKEFLSPEEYKELKLAYCRYHWQMTNEAQEDRANADKLIRQSRILSQLYANRQPHEKRARNLLNQVEVYQSRVLAASRNAQPSDSLTLFEDEVDEAMAKLEATVSNPSPSRNQSYTSWFSAFRGVSHRSESISTVDSSKTLAESEPTDLSTVEDQEYIVSVTHFPKSVSETGSTEDQDIVGKGTNIYRRMIAFENAEKRIEIIDPRFYALDDGETYIPESQLRAMLHIGRKYLNRPDSETTGGEGSWATTTTQPTLETTIQKFRKISLSSP